MLQELIDSLTYGDIHQVVVREWLKSLDLTHSGDIYDKLNEHYESKALTDPRIEELLEDVKVGGNKHVLVLGATSDFWDNLNIQSIHSRAPQKLSRYDESYSIYNSEISENSLRLFLRNQIDFFKVAGGRYSEDGLTKINGQYYCSTLPVKKELISLLEINITRKRIFFWFDSFSDLGKEWSKRSRGLVAEMIVKNITSHQTFHKFPLHRNFQRLQNIDSCKLEKVQKTRKGLNRKQQQTNVTYNMVSHQTEGDPRFLEDPVTEAILAQENQTNTTYEHLKLKWLQEMSNDKLLRDINTTISRMGYVDFQSFATKAEIEYILSKI